MTSDALSGKEQEPRVWGDYRAHGHLSTQNVVNGALLLGALVPSLAAVGWLYSGCDAGAPESFVDLRSSCCSVAVHHPLWFANALFFVNISVGFWVVGLLQRNFWLIDPYWTLTPPLLCHLYQLHPLAKGNPWRSFACLVLVWSWCSRLTHSYFRREEWKFGQREDWRYTKMAKDFPRIWWLLSFFAVGVAQQPMLVGITLPAYSVHSVQAEWQWLDTVACTVAVGGLLLARVADNQLRAYMLENDRLRAAGLKGRQLLDTGIWRYSRHPNYLGETLWWLGFGLFAVRLGQWYMLVGWVINTATLITVTFMTEERMVSNWEESRVKLYLEYRQRTSAWIPLPRFPAKATTPNAAEGYETVSGKDGDAMPEAGPDDAARRRRP